MTTRLLIGHVLDRLSELPDESVHCCVTSPPYYGLRCYGIPDQVWGGEPGCEHVWGALERGKRKDMLPADQTSSTGRSGTTERQDGAAHDGGRFCRRCNAWRGSLGLEPTPALYIEHMVTVFRAVKRVLRKDGVCFINIGDSYAANGGTYRHNNGNKDSRARHDDRAPARFRPGDFKPKDLLGIPWALAFALRDDGWYLRSEITWAKKSPMPESVTDRPTSATEKVFLLTKSGTSTYWTHRDHGGSRTKPAPDYRWQRLRDSREDRIRFGEVEYETAEEPPEWSNDREHWRRVNLWDAHDYFYDAEAVKEEASENTHAMGPNNGPPSNEHAYAFMGGTKAGLSNLGPKSSRNMRNWWEFDNKSSLTNFWKLGPEPFPEAHFATYPTEIPRRAILAGTSERGVCPKCGAGWARVTKSSFHQIQSGTKGSHQKGLDASSGWSDTPRGVNDVETIGWRPTCSCGLVLNPVPATCLDPFLGAGTSALVADQLGRNCIGIELNVSYAEMAERRIRQDAGMFAEIVCGRGISNS